MGARLKSSSTLSTTGWSFERDGAWTHHHTRHLLACLTMSVPWHFRQNPLLPFIESCFRCCAKWASTSKSTPSRRKLPIRSLWIRMTLTHPTTRSTQTAYGGFCCRRRLCCRSFARDSFASRARFTFFGAASICVAHALADAALLPERASSRLRPTHMNASVSAGGRAAETWRDRRSTPTQLLNRQAMVRNWYG